MNFTCVSAMSDVKDNEDEDEESYKPKDLKAEDIKEDVKLDETKHEGEKSKTEEIVKVDDENIYEYVEKAVAEVSEPPKEVSLAPTEEIETEEEQREATPDPLQKIAAQLHGQLQGYRSDFDKFSNLMEEHRPEQPEEEPPVKMAEKKLSREEEISLVKTMSKQDAWSHVMSQVYEVNLTLEQYFHLWE